MPQKNPKPKTNNGRISLLDIKFLVLTHFQKALRPGKRDKNQQPVGDWWKVFDRKRKMISLR